MNARSLPINMLLRHAILMFYAFETRRVARLPPKKCALTFYFITHGWRIFISSVTVYCTRQSKTLLGNTCK